MAEDERDEGVFKTEICKRWLQGTCDYGDECTFAHGAHELKPRMRSGKYKTALCSNFLRNDGVCPYGPRCNFIHAFSLPPKPPLTKSQHPELQPTSCTERILAATSRTSPSPDPIAEVATRLPGTVTHEARRCAPGHPDQAWRASMHTALAARAHEVAAELHAASAPERVPRAHSPRVEVASPGSCSGHPSIAAPARGTPPSMVLSSLRVPHVMPSPASLPFLRTARSPLAFAVTPGTPPAPPPRGPPPFPLWPLTSQTPSPPPLSMPAVFSSSSSVQSKVYVHSPMQALTPFPPRLASPAPSRGLSETYCDLSWSSWRQQLTGFGHREPRGHPLGTPTTTVPPARRLSVGADGMRIEQLEDVAWCEACDDAAADAEAISERVAAYILQGE